jgi:hypothetical protein
LIATGSGLKLTAQGGTTAKKLPYTGYGAWPAIWFLAAPGGSGAEIDLHEGGFLYGAVDPDCIFACRPNSSGNVQYLV